MVILADELSEQILNVLHQEFPSREFMMRRVEVEQIRDRELLRFFVHCLTTEVNFILNQSHVTGDRSTYNITRRYISRLQCITRNIWCDMFREESQRLERIITNIYGESYVQIYTRESYRDDQRFPDGKTLTDHPYYVTFFIASLGWTVVDVDFIEEVSIVFPDVATLIETVGLENLNLVRVSLSYDVFLEDDFNKEFEITRIRMVLYEFLSEIQEHVTEEITFELFYDSRIDFIRDDEDVVWRFLNRGQSTRFTLSELNEFDFTSFFREEY